MWIVLLGAATVISGVAAAEAIVNGTFDTNTSSWIDPGALAGTTFGWSPYDSDGDPHSGSMYVWTNLSDAGLDGPWQCAPVSRGAWALTADTLVTIPAQHIDPFVEMALDFFASSDCTGVASASANDVALNYFQVWETLGLQLDAPPGTRSARVRFFVGGTYDTWMDAASFDDVSLLLVPEPAAGALGGAALAVVALGARRRRASAIDPNAF
jgi:hypothetical protein